MSVSFNFCATHIKGNINEYEKFKSENKFCIILKIYQKSCLTEVRGTTVPRDSLGNLKKILLPLPRIKSPLLSAPAYSLITIMTTLLQKQQYIC
jgi:hypothetical protein